MSTEIDTGDYVRHLPTNEEWVVACIDGEYLYWCGWPQGRAPVSECELTSKAPASERDWLLKELAGCAAGNDHRVSHARRRIAALSGEGGETQ